MPKWYSSSQQTTWDYEFVILVLLGSSSKIIYDRVVSRTNLIQKKIHVSNNKSAEWIQVQQAQAAALPYLLAWVGLRYG